MSSTIEQNIGQEFASFVNDDSVEIFDPSYQNKFLKVFVEDKKNWSQQIIDIMYPEYFEGYHKILINYQMEFFSKYRMPADYDEMRDMVNDKETDELVKEHLNGLIEKVKHVDLPHQKRENVKDRAYTYFKSKKVKNTLIELAVDWKKQTYESMKKKLEDALIAGEPKNIGHNYLKDVARRMKKNHRNPITALKGLDEKMGGGLAPGELGIVLAPPGGGKSMMLVRFAASALLAGKKVVYYSMELSEDVIGQRFDSCLNGIHLNEVWDFKEKIEETVYEIGENGGELIIKDFPTGQATVNNLFSHIETLANNEDIIPDIIMVDYADIMKPTIVYSDKRHTLTGIYEELRGLAVELKIPVWTASQTNRTAMGKEEYGLDSIGESLGKAATADVVLGIGRPDELKIDNIAKVGVLKNRNGADGYYIDLYFDTSKIYIEVMEETVSAQRSNEVGYTKTTTKPVNQEAHHHMNSILQSQ